jgi:hypothetical protein
MEKQKKWMGGKPDLCDICSCELVGIFIDGKTDRGPWGFMCAGCHVLHGVGLGEGRGQAYDVVTLLKVGG